MKIAFFNTKPYDRAVFEEINRDAGHDISFLETRLDVHTAPIAEGHDAVCLFVNDDGSADVVARLAEQGVKVLALRSAGFNHVDLDAAKTHGMQVCRVPAYSPHGVAEHAIAMMMALNRQTHRAYARVREHNFALEGLMGFEMHGKTAGVIGTGKIGAAATQILLGFGCHVLAFDKYPNQTLADAGVEYVELDCLMSASDIVTLHCPLTPETHHLIDAECLTRMKDGVMLINTSRGALIDTSAAIGALKNGKIGHLGLDVYEEEDALFFEDRSADILPDDEFARLLSFPNVLVTGHQAFFTREALQQIAVVTIDNLTRLERGEPCDNVL